MKVLFRNPKSLENAMTILELSDITVSQVKGEGYIVIASTSPMKEYSVRLSPVYMEKEEAEQAICNIFKFGYLLPGSEAARYLTNGVYI